MAKCNSFYIDVNALRLTIRDICLEVMEKTADKIIEQFRNYVGDKGAGKHDWRKNAGEEFKVLAEKLSYEVTEIELGQNPNLELQSMTLSPYAAQISVALFGNHGPLYTKPGTQTWHNHMENRETSNAKTVYALPDGFNWKGPDVEHMLDNTFKQMETSFNNDLASALSSLDFSQFLIVSG